MCWDGSGDMVVSVWCGRLRWICESMWLGMDGLRVEEDKRTDEQVDVTPSCLLIHFKDPINHKICLLFACLVACGETCCSSSSTADHSEQHCGRRDGETKTKVVYDFDKILWL